MLWPREANYSRVSSLLQQDRQPGLMSPILLHFRWVEPLVPFACNAGLTGFICLLQLLPGSEAHMPEIVKSLILPAVKLVSSTGKKFYMTPYNISQLPKAEFTDLYHVRDSYQPALLVLNVLHSCSACHVSSHTCVIGVCDLTSLVEHQHLADYTCSIIWPQTLFSAT